MGTWGLGAFEDDRAADWVWEVEETPTIDFLMQPIEQVLTAGGDVDSPDAVIARAAAELLAALAGKPAADNGESAADVLKKLGRAKPSAVELGKARAAVAAMRKTGELKDLFDEGGHGPTWDARMADLEGRLAG